MLKPVAVIIPVYKDNLSAYEKISLQQCEQVLSQHPQIIIKPKGLNFLNNSLLKKFDNVVSFDDHYFENIAGYNHLMLSPEFYKKFIEYQYILIYQLDAFVFKDELTYWCNQKLDYIGSPWIKKLYHKNLFELFFFKANEYVINHFNIKKKNELKYVLRNKVGNGGFSLRKVETFYNLCLTMKSTIDLYLLNTNHFYNEDVFWSIEVNKFKPQLNIPLCELGLKFAFEVPPVKIKKLNEKNLPFGCHDWDKYADYWRPVFKKYNYDI